MDVIWIAVILVAGILAMLILPSIYFGKKYAISTRSPISRTPSDIGIAYSPVSLMDDGKNIKAWYIPSRGSDKVLIMIPGYGTNKSTLIDLVAPFNKEGFDLLAMDLAGQGESDPDRCTYGFDNFNSVLAAIEWVRSNRETQRKKITVLGFSIGATAALVAASKTDQLDSVIAEGAIYNMKNIMKIQLQVLGLLGSLYVPLVMLVYRRTARASPQQLNALGRGYSFKAKKLMIIQDSLDKISPVKPAREIYAKITAKKEFWEVKESSHTGAFYKNQDEFIRRIADFINE